VAATTSGFDVRHLNFGSRRTDVGQCRQSSRAWPKNMGGEVGIAEQSAPFKKFTLTSGLLVAILDSGNQPTSDNVGSVRDVSSTVANVEVAVGIVSPARSVQYMYFHFRFR